MGTKERRHVHALQVRGYPSGSPTQTRPSTLVAK
jgi:hypothetical protein